MKIYWLIQITFLVTFNSIISCTTENTNGNCSLRWVSQVVYRQSTYVTSTFCWKFWRLFRCKREKTRRYRSTIYVLEQEPNMPCCEGYNQTAGGSCVPDCSGKCIEPMACVSPSKCSCPEGYNGSNCEMAVCSNCPSPMICVEPDTCVCPSGWNGSNCAEDIDECQNNNGECDHFCQNTNGSYRCSCQNQYVLGPDGLTCIGFLNMTLNLTEFDGTPALILQWKEPSWDVRNLTLAVGINCSDTGQGNQILEIRNVSDYELVLTELNLNVTITCCLVPITTEGNGFVICEKASFEKTETTTAPSLDHSLPDSKSVNKSAAIASGLSGAFLLVLLITLLIVVLIVWIGILKRRKSMKVESGSTSNEFEREYNVEIYGMNDNEGNVSETALQYDTLKFDDNKVSSATLKTNIVEGNTEAAIVVYEALDNCPKDEYSHLKYS